MAIKYHLSQPHASYVIQLGDEGIFYTAARWGHPLQISPSITCVYIVGKDVKKISIVWEWIAIFPKPESRVEMEIQLKRFILSLIQ